MATTENWKFPSNANLIDESPMQTPTKVKILGNITREFFAATILNFLFGSIIFWQLKFHQQ